MKRLVASLVIAAREKGMGRKQRRALAVDTRYRQAMAEFGASARRVRR